MNSHMDVGLGITGKLKEKANQIWIHALELRGNKKKNEFAYGRWPLDCREIRKKCDSHMDIGLGIAGKLKEKANQIWIHALELQGN